MSAKQNAANVQRYSKLMVHWQGPYQVTEVVGTTTLHVQNVVGGKTVPVSWHKCIRLGGPELTITKAMAKSALHDLQKFLVEEFLGHKVRRGKVTVHVKWRGYDLDESTWEPIANLYADVPVLLKKYVDSQRDTRLTRAYQRCVQQDTQA